MRRSGPWMLGAVGVGLGLALALVVLAERARADEAEVTTPQSTIFGNPRRGAGEALVQLGGGLDTYDEQGIDIMGVKAPFTLHIGALVQLDYAGILEVSPALESATVKSWSSGWDFRRARIQIDGTMFKAVHYRVRYNFATETFQDIYLDWSRPYDEWDGFLPRIRIGQIREPMSIEALTGGRWTTFMERATPVQAFSPLRNPGVRLQAAPFHGHLTWWLGLFFPNAANLSEARVRSGASVTGRLTWLALAPRDDASRLLSIGGAFNLRFGVEEERFASTSGTARGPPVVDTRTFPAHQTEVYQFEMAFVHGRFSAQSEIYYTHSRPKQGPDVDYHGFYAQASWFLTPPGRNFNRPTAVFSRVKPPRPVLWGKERGLGAWEIAARYSYVDLTDDDGVSGGLAGQITLGLNWYPTQWTRVTLNYIYDDIQDAYGTRGLNGTVHEVGVRFELDF